MIPARRTGRWWVFNVIIPTAVIGLLSWYVYSRRAQFESLADIAVSQLILVGILTAAGFFVNSLEFALLYRVVGAPVGTAEHWMLYAAGQAGNYAPGQLGTVYRFRYLKDVHGLSYADSTAAYSVNFVVTVFATGVVGLIGCIGLGVTEGNWSILLVTVLAGLTVAASLAALIPISDRTRSGRVGSAWMRLVQGWQRARSSKSTALAVLGLEIIRYCLAAWRLDIAFGWLGTDEPFFFFLVIAPIAGLATFVAITPAGLGIREVAIAGAAVALGRSFDSGLLGSSADRAISIVIVLLTGIPGILYSTRVMHRASAARLTVEDTGSTSAPDGADR